MRLLTYLHFRTPCYCSPGDLIGCHRLRDGERLLCAPEYRQENLGFARPFTRRSCEGAGRDFSCLPRLERDAGPAGRLHQVVL